MKKIWVVLIFAIILRLFLAFATFHPDIQALSDSGKFVSRGFLLNLYDQSSETLVLNYPPLIYWYFGFFNLLFNENTALLKLSYLIFDLLLALLLYKIVDPKKGVSAISFWLFNPVNLYATYMMGQFDIIPAFFTMLSIYYIAKDKPVYASFALGVGMAFKLYPIFLIIPLIILASGFWTKIKLAAFAILPYGVSILPYLFSGSFRSNALFASQSSKSLYASIPLSGGESILLFPLSILFFYLLIWNKSLPAASSEVSQRDKFVLSVHPRSKLLRFLAQNKKADKVSYWKIYLIPLLLFFSFTHFHPQWLIWVAPFLILDYLQGFKNIIPMLLIFGSWFISLFFFDSSLTLGIFSPLIPALKNVGSIWDILNLDLDYNFFRSILQTTLAASSFYLIYQYFPKKNNEV